MRCYKEKSEKLNDPDHFKHVMVRMKNMKEHQNQCDVQIKTDNGNFYMHSNVLYATTDFQPSDFPSDKNMKDIHIGSVFDYSVERMINYFYTGNLEWDETSADRIFKVAGLLKVTTILRKCSKFLETVLNEYNCCEVFKLAKKFSCFHLAYVASEFIRKNISPDLLHINGLSCEELIELISLDLDVSNEITVWNIVNQWINRDSGEQNAYNLLEFVKLPFLPENILRDEVAPFCSMHPQCQPLLHEAIQWQKKPDIKLKSFRTEQREPVTTILAVGAWTEQRASILEIYNPLEENWILYGDMKLNRRNYSVVFFNDCLWFIGGSNPSELFNTVETFDLKTGKVQTMKPLNTVRDHPAVGVLENSIYVVGGSGPNGSLNTAEKWNPKTNSWTDIPSMSTARSGSAFVVLRNKLYVIGGWETSASAVVEAFCPVKEEWMTCAPMNVMRMWSTAAAIGKYIYVVGGRELNSHITTKYSSVERYDTIYDRWNFIEDIKSPRYGIGAGVLFDKLLAIGGADGNAVLANVEEYDPSTNVWIEKTPMNTAREITNIVNVPWKLIKNLKFRK